MTEKTPNAKRKATQAKSSPAKKPIRQAWVIVHPRYQGEVFERWKRAGTPRGAPTAWETVGNVGGRHYNAKSYKAYLNRLEKLVKTTRFPIILFEEPHEAKKTRAWLKQVNPRVKIDLVKTEPEQGTPLKESQVGGILKRRRIQRVLITGSNAILAEGASHENVARMKGPNGTVLGDELLMDCVKHAKWEFSKLLPPHNVKVMRALTFPHNLNAQTIVRRKK